MKIPYTDPPTPPEPPKPPDMLDATPEKPPIERDFIEDVLGCSHLDAALMALNKPYLWEPEEIEFFESVLQGMDYDKNRLESLLKEQIHGNRSSIKEPTQPTPKSSTDRIADELSEISQMGPETYESVPIRESNVRSFGPMGQIDVGKWWEK